MCRSLSTGRRSLLDLRRRRGERRLPLRSGDVWPRPISGLRDPVVDESADPGLERDRLLGEREGPPASRSSKDADALLSSSPPLDSCPLCGQAGGRKKLTSRVRDVLTGLLESSREMERRRSGVAGVRDALLAALEAAAGAPRPGPTSPDRAGRSALLPSALSAGSIGAPRSTSRPSRRFANEHRACGTSGARTPSQKSAPAGATRTRASSRCWRSSASSIRAWRSAENGPGSREEGARSRRSRLRRLSGRAEASSSRRC